MTGLARPDPNALLRGVDSFAARAVALGLDHGRLPGTFGDALLAFLRARSLAFAQARRTGIALGRDQLGRGVRQAFICLDLGLEEAAGGDVEVAIGQLAFDQLAPLSRRGYEIAFGRLLEMRNTSRQLAGTPQLALFPELRDQLRFWSRLVPETWAVPHRDREPEPVDPARDYTAFQEVAGRTHFLASLPEEQLAPLGQLPFLTFGDLWRRLAAAAALGLEHLAPGSADARRFRQHCCDGPHLRPAARERTTSTLTRFLQRHVPYESARRLLLDELRVQLDAVEAACATDRELLLCLREDLALGEAEAAAAADAASSACPQLYDA